jgi:hypothetical protein
LVVRQLEMRVLLWVGVVLVIGIGAFYGAVILASESGEVVTLRTGSGSETRATRLWVVDHGGAEWVRTGHSEKRWFRQVKADALVELDRAGAKSLRTAVPVLEPELSHEVNEAFRIKYGAADWFVALSGDASQRIVVRLDPRP